jgi:hypothetical protein
LIIHLCLKQVTDRIVHDIFSPPVASRIYAYVSVAAYEAYVPGHPELTTLSNRLNGLRSVPQPSPSLEYCYPIASAYAALTVGKALVFSEAKIDEFVTQLSQEFRSMNIPDDVYDRSAEYGESVGRHIIDWAGKDNYKESRSFAKYTIQQTKETWKPTPPAYMDAVEPHWNTIRPFTMDSASQFLPAPPIEFSLANGSPFYAQAEEVFTIGSHLSKEQRSIASFWDCNPFVMNVRGHVMFATKKISPGGHWINITQQACEMTNTSFGESLRAYALVSLALADGFISAWDEKYRSKLIRPETYINEYINEDWTPLLQTPPFPEYPSAHSVISGASAVVLTDLFGEDFHFTDSTEVEFGMPPRSFNSFYEAADEAAISRLYGGIHYRRACEIGKSQGRKLGRHILEVIDRKVSQAKAEN